MEAQLPCQGRLSVDRDCKTAVFDLGTALSRAALTVTMETAATKEAANPVFRAPLGPLRLPNLMFSYRPGLLVDIKRDPREIVIRRADTFVVGRADFDCHERSGTGGSLIRGTSSRD